MLVDPAVNTYRAGTYKPMTRQDKSQPPIRRARKSNDKPALTKPAMVESAAHLCPDDYGGISVRLREAMRHAGVNNGAQIAREVGCTRAAINKYLRNPGASVEAHLLFRIADYLNVDPRWLLEGVGSMTNPTTRAMVVARELEPFPEWLKFWLENGEYLVARQTMKIRRRPISLPDTAVDNGLQGS